ncbi:probable AMP deaminase isoform X2 [Solanum dulcamara]|uniref:probable AMP deaminase isoform X2 n=1 Tax=Solanum dulcamara TaxID=45834 RepID=UPI00248673C9|nr:probable AMP deaminase isoform X2 [Solanum dulcamara]
MEPWLSPSTSQMQLAVAALFGASVMAISAFYLHKRSVDEVLERLIKLRRKRRHSFPTSDSEPEDFDFNEDEIENVNTRNVYSCNLSTSIDNIDDDYDDNDNNVLGSYRVSSSMPNVRVSNEWMNEDSSFDRTVKKLLSNSVEKLNSIPSSSSSPPNKSKSGEERVVSSLNPTMRVESVGKPMTPKLSGDSAFESAGNSNEDKGEFAVAAEDVVFSYENDIGPTEEEFSISALTESHIHLQHKTAAPEARSNIDHDVREVDKPSMHVVENDPSFFNNILPATTHDPLNVEEEEVLKFIRECLDLREKYVYREEIAPWMKETKNESKGSDRKHDPFSFGQFEATSHHFKMEDGVVRVYASENDTEELFPVASATTFFTDMHHVLKVMAVGNVRSYCHHRLRFLEEKFRLHLLVNADREFLAQKSAPHRDFYNIRKVDTHVHHSACMNQKHLLRFIKSKLRKEPDEVVIFRDGQYLTLKEVFESLDLTGYDMNVDLLDVHADKSTFHRFDKFNLKYNPCGQSRLREIFLKQDNLIQGRFLAEVTKEVLQDLEASKYQLAEYRISIYGRKQSEWDTLASWFVNNELYSQNAVWLIQLPRLYNVYRSMGTVTSFQNILDNVFIPLFEVTVDPKSHPHLHLFLMQVVGFDMVDDESKPERRPTKHMPKPDEWTNQFNPAFSYYAYYCYANLYTLNKLRESKGLPTIRLRPHCGEAGDVDHLAAGFLLCHNISHGINLRKTPVLHYLYYLAQVGLAMSPLSNNSLFLDYNRNPFLMFFHRGMNVSLSTDDPLQIHLTKEPLVEEYSVAAKVWKLSSCDLCEIARNSVYQSGFNHADKMHWLGNKYYKRSPQGNDIHKTNVPNTRISFRHETWKEEMQYVYRGKTILPEDVEH